VHGALERARVMVGTSHPATTALDTARRGLPPLLRVSAHYFADDADLARLAAELRSLSDRAPARRAAASSADARA
jgi:selenocysteine lyase/cysteine desulfurase